VEARDRRVFEDLGRRVREVRRERSWTQEDAAERLGVDVRELQRIEAGRVNMTLQSLVRMARSLGVPVRELFEAPASRGPRKPGRPPKAGA
jgi:transcriptional regulator with XRE-family HTH domain